MASMADEAVERRRLEEQMERVDLAAPPRVELTYTPPGGLDLLAESVGVLDASFNPPTRAHMYLLDVAAQRFGCAAFIPPPLLAGRRSHPRHCVLRPG